MNPPVFRAFSSLFLTLSAPVLQAAGTFSTAPLTGDGDSGISGDHAYTHAIDMGDAGNRTINGAVFTGSGGGGNPTTSSYETTNLPNVLANWPGVNPPGPSVSGATGGLFTNFNYGGVPAETLTLRNLRVGQQYQTTFYNALWGGPRSQTITTSDGGSIVFDQDATAASLLSYTFTATSNTQTFTFTPNQPASFHHYGFTNQVLGQKALFTDNFYAPSNPATGDLNFNNAARQGGSIVTTSGVKSWVGAGNTQVGNPTGAVDSGNYLLTAFGGTAALDYNFNGSASAGGLSVSFDMAPNSTAFGDTTNWQAINIGQSAANKNDFVNSANPHLGVLFRGNGLMEVWDGNTNVTPVNPAYSAVPLTNQLTRIEMLFTDPGDQNPFDGVGQTDLALYVNGVLTYNFSKGGGGYADNYLNFHNSHIGAVDNLVIAQIIPEPGAATLAAAAGLMTLRRRRRCGA